MSSMRTNNPHVVIAEDDYNYTTDYRQVEATLAVAYAQDTANLIAFVNWIDTHNAQVGGSDYDKAVGEIMDRLGLND